MSKILGWPVVKARFSDPSAFNDAVSEHLEPVAHAVKTAGRVAQTRPGISICFGAFRRMSTTLAGGERGVEVKEPITIRFQQGADQPFFMMSEQAAT